MSSSSSSESKKMVVLQSRDGESFEVEETVAMESAMVKAMIEDLGVEVYPLGNVTGKILTKVIEFCKRHANSDPDAADKAAREAELKAFDAEFIKEVKDMDTMCELILAANYLNIQALLDVTTQAVADQIKDMQPEEVRRMFNIQNDFTAEEEAKLREENAWAFEK